MRRTVIFDLGGVLLDWNPRHLYRKLFADEAAMEDFLSNVCTMQWHLQHDAGEPFAKTCAELKAKHPSHADLIDAFGTRHREMFAGTIEGSVALVENLSERGVPLFALTNFPAETFSWARAHYRFFRHFRDVVVSGQERVLKPDPRIFQILLERNAIDPRTAVYIDDNVKNVEVSRSLGLYGIHFTAANRLGDELSALGLLNQP